MGSGRSNSSLFTAGDWSDSKGGAASQSPADLWALEEVTPACSQQGNGVTQKGRVHHSHGSCDVKGVLFVI